MFRQVPVAGGVLSIEVLHATTEPVLAIHGLTSNCRLWNWVRAAAPSLSIIAPDLRGRGRSLGVGGPSSLRRHTEDMVAVLDALGISSATVCGMSMGGYIAVDMAIRYPSRVRSLLLVDGGLPAQHASSSGLSRDELAQAFASQLARTERSWSGLGEYARYFLETTPLLDGSDPLLLDYLNHDLAGGRVQLDPEAVLSDAADVFAGRTPYRELSTPTRLLYAQWGSGRDSIPTYSQQVVEGFRQELACVTGTELIPGVDHASSIMSGRGGAVVAEHLRELAAAAYA